MILLPGLVMLAIFVTGQAVGLTPTALTGLLARAGALAAEIVEALAQAGWPATDLLAPATYLTLSAWVGWLYLRHHWPLGLKRPRRFGLLLFLVALFGGLAWIMLPGQTLGPYLFPLATLAIMVAVLIEVHLSLLVTLLLGLFCGYLADGSLPLAVYTIMGGLIGVLSLGRRERTSRLLAAGAHVALSNLAVILLFHLSGRPADPGELVALLVAGVANGALSASLALIGLFLVGHLGGIPTSLHLQELAQPTQPLLRELLLRAPGTYHHSLLVSNLAEQGAERIGANALLTRVGAYYHDVGKIARPGFFVENQLNGSNVHDGLEPHTSAQIIVGHVADGLKLARKYRLPGPIRAFIAEHHGTSRVQYFYRQALAQAGSRPVPADDFRYPGPRPQSKETALVMLADSCEAAVRAVRPDSVAELEQLVRRLIADKITAGQLDECNLTMRELEIVRQTFGEMLQGVLHQRLDYPPEPEAAAALAGSGPQSAAPAPAIATRSGAQGATDAADGEPPALAAAPLAGPTVLTRPEGGNGTHADER